MSKEIRVVKIDEVIPHPKNPRRGDVPAIMRSLEKHGQIPPIVVQKSTNYIVKGNHTWKALKRMGRETVEVIFEDLDDDKALSYLLADNRTSDRSTYDPGALYGVLSEVLVLEGTGFDENDVEMLAEGLRGKKKEKQKTGPVEEPEELEVHDAEEAADVPEPMREIPLRMSASRVQEFGGQIMALQNLWELSSFVDVVLRAVAEAHDRWKANVGGRVGSDAALPAEMVGTEY